MINVLDIKVGQRLLLQGGISAEVVENMEDGMWLQVKYLASPDENDVGSIELCHAQDILKITDAPEGV